MTEQTPRRVPVLAKRPARGVRVKRKGKPAPVLRRGPSELAIGVIGVVLLLAMVILIPLLPDPEPPVVQAEVTFNRSTEDFDFAFNEYLGEDGQTILDTEVPVPNVYEIELEYVVLEDLPSSFADRFSVTVQDFDRVAFGPPTEVPTLAPLREGTPASFVPVENRVVQRIQLQPLPTTQLETALDFEPLNEFTTRLGQKYAVAPVGFLEFDVRLIDLGQCPDETALDFERFLDCSLEGGEDAGNAIELVRMTLIRYTPQFEILGDAEEDA